MRGKAAGVRVITGTGATQPRQDQGPTGLLSTLRGSYAENGRHAGARRLEILPQLFEESEHSEHFGAEVRSTNA